MWPVSGDDWSTQVTIKACSTVFLFLVDYRVLHVCVCILRTQHFPMLTCIVIIWIANFNLHSFSDHDSVRSLQFSLHSHTVASSCVHTI